jgi:hypothetical protein
MNNQLLSLNLKSQMTFAGGKVKITPTQGGYHLHTPYHKGFVEDLKTQLPGHARRFDKTTKAWWVSEPYLTAAVLDIIAAWFDPALKEELAKIRAEMPPAIELIAEVY